MNKLLHFFLTLAAVILFSCKDPVVSTGAQPLGKIVFELEHVNHAWGYYYKGSYAGEDGKIYTYDLAKANIQWKENPDGYYTEEELTSKYHHFDTLRSTIPSDTIQWSYNLAVMVNPEMISDTTLMGADMGITRCSIYLFHSERKKYEKIILNQEGDWRWYNTSPSAVELTEWFKRSQN